MSTLLYVVIYSEDLSALIISDTCHLHDQCLYLKVYFIIIVTKAKGEPAEIKKPQDGSGDGPKKVEEEGLEKPAPSNAGGGGGGGGDAPIKNGPTQEGTSADSDLNEMMEWQNGIASLPGSSMKVRRKRCNSGKG